MKKIYLILFIAIGLAMSSLVVNAQELGPLKTSFVSSDKDACSGVTQTNLTVNKSTKSTWDILINYNITDTAGANGYAGVAYFNNVYWVSKWAMDTIFEFNAQGQLLSSFVIPGLTGVRSFSWDGTYVYAGNNTTTIYRINPTTKTLASPHTTVAATARWVTYDGTLDGGNGGFWYGNFNTNIVSVNMSGTVLNTIPAATHGLSGMYGAAADTVSPGGPYLWVFAQMPPNNSQIKAITLPSGTPTVHDHDVMSDVGVAMGLTSGLAGGLFFSQDVSHGNLVLMGIVQGTPDNILFGYDLDLGDTLIDLKASSLRSTKGYSQIPFSQVFAETFELGVKNVGIIDFDTVYVDIDFFFNGTPVGTTTLYTLNLISNATYDFTSAPFTPSNGVGLYEVRAHVYPGNNQTDTISNNDTISFTFLVTDTVYARDNGIPDGGIGYGVSSSNWAYATSNFELFNDDTLSGIWIQLATPLNGDTTYAVVANTLAGIPNSILQTGTIHIIDSSITEYFLEFSNSVPLTAGTYAFGCYEGNSATINLAQSPDIFTTGTNFFYSNNAWTESGIQTARFIRPCFVNSIITGHTNLSNGQYSFSLFPNPANNQINVIYEGPEVQQFILTLMDISGRVVLEKTISNSSNSVQTIDVSALPQGFYVMNINSDTLHEAHKILISR